MFLLSLLLLLFSLSWLTVIVDVPAVIVGEAISRDFFTFFVSLQGNFEGSTNKKPKGNESQTIPEVEVNRSLSFL